MILIQLYLLPWILITASSAAPISEMSSGQAIPSDTAQYIRRIIFYGNTSLEDDELAELLAISPGQRFNPQSIDNGLPKILAKYKSLGYMFASIEWEVRPVEQNQVAVYMKIQEGEQVRMGVLDLSGNLLLPKTDLLDRLDILKSPLFDEFTFQSDMDQLLEIYSEYGYPLAKVSLAEFQIKDGKLNVKLDIDAGPLIRIRNIDISGLKKTREKVIRRELTVCPGQVFRQSDIDRSQRRLNNLGYFESVKASYKGQTDRQHDPEQIDVELSVMERPTGHFSGVIGYNPSSDQIGSQKLTGVLELGEGNLFGTGRKLSIRARFGLINTYEFSYEEPWILNAPVDVEIRLWGTKQESQNIGHKTQDMSADVSGLGPDDVAGSIEEWAGRLMGTTRVIRSIESSLGVTYKRIESPVAGGGISPESSDNIISGQKYSISSAIQRDSRDYFINPSEGRLDRISVEVARGDFRTFRASLDMNQYFETWQRQVFALGFHGARIWGEKIPITELLYLGGANTLRGYSEDFFRGEGSILVNSEYRFLTARDSQFFLFLDGGTVYNRGEGLDSLKVGYGVGMRLKSRTGLVSMDYGLARGDSVLSGKVHVSLGAMF